VTLPRFFNRLADATVPILGGIGRDLFEQRLAATGVRLRVGENAPEAMNAGFMLAANVAARSYPAIALDAPAELAASAASLVRAINPHCELLESDAEVSGTLTFAPAPPADGEVTVWASGWNVIVDAAREPSEPPAIPAVLAAAAIGLGELFRLVFADLLGNPGGRTGAQPGTLNVVTLSAWTEDLPIESGLDVGRVHLVGGGAIGEAAVETLRVSGVSGELFVVDDETVVTSNLQRYVFTTDLDEGALKTALVVRALAGSDLVVTEIRQKWGVDRPLQGALDSVLVALDSAVDRIGVQASLPQRTYNAYTQPADIGWSRHEAFGKKACLACLYWPRGLGPSDHERIGDTLGESPMRVLAYLASRLPVGRPLPSGIFAPPIEATGEEQAAWTARSLLDDVLERFPGNDAVRTSWAQRAVDELYREGFCGGGIITVGVNGTPQDVLVPLAHQSVLAGIMLAVALLAATEPTLAAARPPELEARFDVLRGLPQSPAIPRAMTPGCLCADADFIEFYAAQHPIADGGAAASQPENQPKGDSDGKST
jgi:hypothetical protein